MKKCDSKVKKKILVSPLSPPPPAQEKVSEAGRDQNPRIPYGKYEIKENILKKCIQEGKWKEQD